MNRSLFRSALAWTLLCALPVAAQTNDPLPHIITTVAGGGIGDLGPATDARLDTPMGIAFDASGNLLIADSYNNRVRVVSPSGAISTFAGTGAAGYSGDNGPQTTANLNSPGGVAVGGGSVYIADSLNNRIRRVSATGITTVAGNGVAGSGGDNGPATSASLNGPTAVAVDASGNLFIADSGNHRIRKVSAAGVITTIAGTGVAGFSGDNFQATNAQLSYPGGVAFDGAGNLLIADTANNRIRRVSLAGLITTIAGGGTGGDNGLATNAYFYGPNGVIADASGNLFIADSFGDRVRKVSPAGLITTIAGTGTAGFGGDLGPATAAKLNGPSGLALDSLGNLYIADAYNNRIRKVTPAGVITTFAGGCSGCTGGDGGPATRASLRGPNAVAFDASGNLFIADSFANTIRKVSPSGVISTAAGTGAVGFSGDNGQATSAKLNYPDGMAVDASGNLFVADSSNGRIRRISPAGVITTVAGNGTFAFSGDTGPAASASLNGPHGVALDGSGNLFIADSANNRIRKVSTGGTITTIAGTGTFGFQGDNGQATSARLAYPTGLAFDASGNLYIADYGNGRIRKVSPAGTITTVAGGGAVGVVGDNGPATSAYLDSPRSVVVDVNGNLYIADAYGDRIRMVTPAGIITTVAGSGVAGFGGDNGLATSANLNSPNGVALDGSGDLYIADLLNQRIRKVGLTALPDPPRLLNLSSRGQVSTGFDVMIAGFIVGGPSAKTVVVNVAGPSLANYGVAGPLANPTLTLVRSSDNAILASNDDWQQQPPADVAAINNSGFAPSNLLEPAIIKTLDPGVYTAIVSGAAGGTGVGLVGVYEVDHPEVPLLNISTRGRVGTGFDVMIGGFVVTGDGPQTVVVRAIGPSLANYGVSGALANPQLQLVRSSDQVVMASNDDWGTAPNASLLQSLAPSDPRESAIYITLQPGAYTAIVSGVNNTTGVGLVEVYTVAQ